MITIDTEHGTADLPNSCGDLIDDMFVLLDRMRIPEPNDLYSLESKMEIYFEEDFKAIARYLYIKGYPTPQRIRGLYAHGDNINGEFQYFDEQNGKEVYTPVTHWLKKYESLYDVLYVSSCNPGGIRLNPIKSFIIYPLDNNKLNVIKLASLECDLGILTIVPPINFRNESQDQLMSHINAIRGAFKMKPVHLDHTGSVVV